MVPGAQTRGLEPAFGSPPGEVPAPVLIAALTKAEVPSIVATVAASEDLVPLVIEMYAGSAVRPWAGQGVEHSAAAGCPALFALSYGAPALGRSAALAVEKTAGGASLLAGVPGMTEGTTLATGGHAAADSAASESVRVWAVPGRAVLERAVLERTVLGRAVLGYPWYSAAASETNHWMLADAAGSVMGSCVALTLLVPVRTELMPATLLEAPQDV